MPIPEIIIDGCVAVDLTVVRPPIVRRAYLNLSIPRQRLNNWCWAAVSAGLDLAYRDPLPRTQCAVAKLVLKKPCTNDGCVTVLQACDTATTLPAALGPHFLKQHKDPIHRTIQFLEKEIGDGNPVAVRCAFRGQKAGHFVVISGIRKIITGDADLRVWDPKGGTFSTERLSQFLRAFKQVGEWERSFETRGDRPVPPL